MLHESTYCITATHFFFTSDYSGACKMLFFFYPLYDTITFISCREIMWPVFIYYARNFQSHTYIHT